MDRSWGIAIIVALAILWSPAFCFSEDNTTNSGVKIKFTIHYGMVSHVLMHDEGCFDQLLNSKQHDNLEDFWWGYIMRQCKEYLISEMETYNKRTSRTTGNDSYVDLRNYMDDVMKRCAMSVIYDNWDRINKTITINPVKDCVKPMAKKK